MLPPGLLGKPAETVLNIEGNNVRALLDTGSTVSTLAHSYFKKYLSDTLELQELETLLDIECAGGTQLPYLGYIEAKITMQKNNFSKVYPILIIPDSQYNQNVPLLLGTNILETMMTELKEQHGERYLQNARLTTPWYLTFRSIALQEKQLTKNQNRLALIRSAEVDKIIIPPNTETTIKGYRVKELPYKPTPCMLQQTSLTTNHQIQDLDIEPSLHQYDYQNNNIMTIKISNVTTSTIAIPPRAIVCEMQPVTIQPVPKEDIRDDTPVTEKVKEIMQSDLTDEQFQDGKDLINAYTDIFSRGDDDVGHTDRVQHRIDLTDERPFKQRYRRIPPAMYDEVKSHLRQLMSNGIIRPSHSPYASNVVLVKKKDGSLRLCVDYRQLNNITKKDSYAIPRIEELLECLAGSKFFSVVDMKSGYYQVEIKEEHKERTAFTVGSLGFYEYNRLPFGLTNSPATYQRLMEECLADLNLKICCIFIDDIIIYGKTYEEHLKNLQLVFNRIREANLKLAPGKSEFFKRRVKYVGHLVSEEGIEINKEKTDIVTSWPKPSTPVEVRRFLGFVGYYRRFIHQFSKISKPLTELMPAPTKKHHKTKLKTPWHWGAQQDKAFEQLKQQLVSAPILGYADSSTPYELHTDASGDALGAVLYQEQHGIKRVISYASRSLSKAERNYPAHKREFLALKWAVADKFKDYLYGSRFTILTDNNPVTYVLTTAKLDAAGHRWLASLAAFNFDIRYRPGKSNADADALSRLPAEVDSDNRCNVPIESVQAICRKAIPSAYVESLSLSPDVVIDDIDNRGTNVGNIIDWAQAQANDIDIRPWIEFVRQNRKPSIGEIGPSPLMRQFNRLCLKDDVLYRETTIDGEVRKQLVLPITHASTVLEALHNDMGHPGKDRTLSLLRDRFYWPGMHKDTEQWIEQCGRCIRRKTPTNQRAPLVNISTSSPMELVAIDYLTLEPSKGGCSNILVITDHYTRYAQAIPTRNQTAKTTADALFNHFIVHYGIPQRLHSDQGANFEGKVIKELCKLTGMQKSRTTSYHPIGNGMTERFNRTLLNMLGSLENHQKANWKQYVGPLVHAYNCTRHESTGQSPHLLMFGRNPRLPIDVAFSLREEDRQPSTKYVQELRERLAKAYQLAEEAAKKARDKQKQTYDTKVRGANILVGDKVLVRIVAFDGKHKLSNKWEEEPYDVIDQPNKDIPVFTVQRESGTGRKRTLHRNLLLPIGYIYDREKSPIKESTKQDKHRISLRKRQDKLEDSESESTSDEESDYDNNIVFNPEGNMNTDRTVVDDSFVPGVDEPQSEDNISEVVDIDTEPHGDAHTATETRQEVTVGNESAPIVEDGESQQEITPEADTSLADSEDTGPDVPVRRSIRTRKPPAWYTSGDYETSKSAVSVKSEWMQKVDCITNLVDSDLFTDMKSEAARTILDILRPPTHADK